MWYVSWKKNNHKYLMEGILMALFMFSIAVMGTVLEHPASPIYQTLPWAWVRRLLMGISAGLSLVLLIYSPWGQTSGAHLNPAVTLAYWQIGKISIFNAVGYIVAQFSGACIGMALAVCSFGNALSHPNVEYIATQPGHAGLSAAFVAEWTLSFLLMFVVRITSLKEQWSKWTGIFVGCFVFLFVLVESPISGTSLNPARTLSASLFANQMRGLWIYFIAPPLGMWCAVEVIRQVMVTLKQLRKLPVSLKAWHTHHPENLAKFFDSIHLFSKKKNNKVSCDSEKQP